MKNKAEIRKPVNFDTLKRRLLRNPEVLKAYKEMQPEYAIISALMKARIKGKITQAELAERIGTTQSAVARFEAGKANPTLSFLKRLAGAIDARLEIRFIQ